MTRILVFRRAAVAMTATLLVLVAGAAPAAAATKRCEPFRQKLGGASFDWKIQSIRLTTGFRCKDARTNIRSWVRLGGKVDNPRALTPWTCSFDPRITCELTTSFGGTRPERTYELSFRVSVPPQ